MCLEAGKCWLGCYHVTEYTPPCSLTFSASWFSMQLPLTTETQAAIPTSHLVFMENIFSTLVSLLFMECKLHVMRTPAKYIQACTKHIDAQICPSIPEWAYCSCALSWVYLLPWLKDPDNPTGRHNLQKVWTVHGWQCHRSPLLVRLAFSPTGFHATKSAFGDTLHHPYILFVFAANIFSTPVSVVSVLKRCIVKRKFSCNEQTDHKKEVM